MSALPPKQAGIPAADGGATDRNNQRPAIRGNGTPARSARSGRTVAVLGARDLETAALLDETQVIAPGNGDTFGPEMRPGVRHQIERAA
jgi:hypothetical protein